MKKSGLSYESRDDKHIFHDVLLNTVDKSKVSFIESKMEDVWDKGIKE